MRKYILTMILGTCFFSLSWGQQEDQYTQFMHYKMGLNPAYAGSNDGACISLLGRQQWIGFEGAPQSQLITFNMPLLNQRVGIGASIIRSAIGITEKYTAELVYAYRIRMGRGHLCMGLQGSVRLMQINFSDADPIQGGGVDQAIPPDLRSKYVPNFGAGIYYSGSSFFVGFSAPRLLENNIDLADSEDIISREVPHFYFMGGAIFPLGDNLEMQPQMLMKYVKGAPFDADVNINFIISDKFILGTSYRLGGSRATGVGEAISGLIGFEINNSLLFSISYDYTLSELQAYNNGSAEAVIRYCIGGKSEGSEYISPRFF